MSQINHNYNAVTTKTIFIVNKRRKNVWRKAIKFKLFLMGLRKDKNFFCTDDIRFSCAERHKLYYLICIKLAAVNSRDRKLVKREDLGN